MTNPHAIEAAGEANAARLPAERPNLYADWAQPGAELQPFDAAPLADAIDNLDRGISRLIWGAVAVCAVAALALFGGLS